MRNADPLVADDADDAPTFSTRGARAHWTDFFATEGYQLLVLSMLKQTLLDVRGSDATARREAVEWFNRRDCASVVLVAGSNELVKIPQPGLTFEDCLQLSGLRVQLDEFRRQAVKDPKGVYRLVQSRWLSLQSEKRHKLVPPIQTRVGWGEIGPARLNWVFGAERPQPELEPEV